MNSSHEYMLFFHGPDWDRGKSVEEAQAIMDRVHAWMEGLSREGRVKGGQVLDRAGTTVVAKGQMVTDGPFAESKEAIGGALILEAADFEEAVAIAKRCPTLQHGISIEVRAILTECPVSARLRAKQLAGAALVV